MGIITLNKKFCRFCGSPVYVGDNAIKTTNVFYCEKCIKKYNKKFKEIEERGIKNEQ